MIKKMAGVLGAGILALAVYAGMSETPKADAVVSKPYTRAPAFYRNCALVDVQLGACGSIINSVAATPNNCNTAAGLVAVVSIVPGATPCCLLGPLPSSMVRGKRCGTARPAIPPH